MYLLLYKLYVVDTNSLFLLLAVMMMSETVALLDSQLTMMAMEGYILLVLKIDHSLAWVWLLLLMMLLRLTAH